MAFYDDGKPVGGYGMKSNSDYTIEDIASDLGGGGSEGVGYDWNTACYVAFVDDTYRSSAPSFSSIRGNLKLKTNLYVKQTDGISYSHLLEGSNGDIDPDSSDRYFFTSGAVFRVPLGTSYTLTGATLWKSDGMGGFVKYADYDDNFFSAPDTTTSGEERTFTTIPNETRGKSGPSFYFIYLHATS